MKVFISGPMNGIPEFNVPMFNKAETMLTTNGFSVFNPAWLKVDETWTHEQLMEIDLKVLSMCDAVYQLSGWQNSKGALEEAEFAKANDIPTFEHIVDLMAYCAKN